MIDEGTESISTSIYHKIRHMTVNFHFRPGDRINEGKLAKELAVSRTPLREAMQQLVSEKLLRWERNKGFFCRELIEKEICDLYEYRQLLEEKAIKLLCTRASDETLEEIDNYYQSIHGTYDSKNIVANLNIDQNFHETLAKLCGNEEIYHALCNVNQRIYFIRWIDLSSDVTFQPSHQDIVKAIVNRNEEIAVDLINRHVSKRQEEIAGSIRKAYGLIFTGQHPDT